MRRPHPSEQRDIEDDMRLESLAANSGDQLALQVLQADRVRAPQQEAQSSRDRAK